MARLFTAVGALVSLAGAVPAVAQTASPDWIATPTPQDMCRAYPDGAREQGVEGGAVLICDVAPDDKLENCSVQTESPEGRRFGEAAMGVVQLFALRPASWPMGVPLKLPIRFKLPCNPGPDR